MLVLCPIIFFAILSVSRCFELNLKEITCENMGQKSKWDAHLPLNISLGTNYKATLRFTDFLHGNITAKIMEKQLENVLVVKKWTREKEVAVFNRTIYFEDQYTLDEGKEYQHISHHKLCKAIGKANEGASTSDATANLFDLSSRIINGTGLTGESLGQLLALFQRVDGWNGTLHSDKLLTNGVETMGYTGCRRNFTGDGSLRLQVELEYATEKTPQQPYNPEQHNPSLYTVRVLTYDGQHLIGQSFAGNKTNVYDYFSADIVTLDVINGESKELFCSPPRGVFCHGMPSVPLPVQFSHPFVAHIRTAHSNKSHHDAAAVSDSAVVYDDTSKIVGMLTETPNEIVVHDFVYGLQYELDMDHHGKCGSVEAINADLHDVARTSNSTLYLRSAEDLIIWMGKMKKGTIRSPFYHSGKVQLVDELLDSYVSQFIEPQQNATVVEVLVTNSTIGNGSIDQQRHRSTIRSVVHYSKDGRTNVAFVAIRPQLNSWQTLAAKLRGCLNATTADSTGGYFVRMGNVSLAELNAQTGLEWSKAAIAHALANASGVSSIRIADLNLEESNEGILYAFFAIGAPSGAVQAKTIYLRKEIAVAEATQLLNASITSGTFVVRIPLSVDLGSKKQLIFSGTHFGERSSLLPHPSPPPSPSPAPQFVGFSGSTLAIVAIFCSIFGATSVISAYILHQKRQYIRGMAYQVFE